MNIKLRADNANGPSRRGAARVENHSISVKCNPAGLSRILRLLSPACRLGADDPGHGEGL